LKITPGQDISNSYAQNAFFEKMVLFQENSFAWFDETEHSRQMIAQNLVFLVN